MVVADKIAEWLADKEITHAFGIVGAGNLAIFDAIAKKKKTQIVCCHHEQAAVMAAGFYYRASGRLSVCIVTTGAGSSNAITGCLAAFMDSTPVIILSGNEPSKYLSARTPVLGVQGFDSSGVVKPICKWSSRALYPAHVHHELRLAYSFATGHGRFGPVWIDIPRDIQTQPC